MKVLHTSIPHSDQIVLQGLDWWSLDMLSYLISIWYHMEIELYYEWFDWILFGRALAANLVLLGAARVLAALVEICSQNMRSLLA
jgi:hypothetical protein